MTVLRLYGEDFDVDRFIAETPFNVVAVHRRGEPGARPGSSDAMGGMTNGVHVSVSVAGWHDFAAQMRDVQAFLVAAKAVLRNVRQRYAASTLALDVPVYRRLHVAVHSYAVGAEIAALLGDLGIDLMLSVYPPDLSTADGDADPVRSRIASHPELASGKPVIRGTHVLVRMIVGMLADGLEPWQIREHHPDVELEDIAAAAAYVAQRGNE